ncbi:TauD/TfdA family dioxygenase [Streptomyces sp. NPDC001351]|uniref:TauD/TfdA family dioxygenase n=1 Tax=Streptomyces sp. NPDC001351 TaxID=3364564 RepID=UPI0036AB14D6
MSQQVFTDSLPDAPLNGPEVWRGAELAAVPEEWLVELDEQDLDELEQLPDVDGPLHLADPAAFRLPRIADKARRWRQVLENGPGVLLVRGLPVAHVPTRRSAVLYWALGLAVGTPTPQDKRELYLADVREDGAPGPDRFAYQTSVELPFHTDWCDVVSLLCLARSRSGGTSRIASSALVFNEILRRRPDLVVALAEPLWMNNRDEADGDVRPYYAASHVSWVDGKLSFRRRPSWRKRAASSGRPQYLQQSAVDGPPPPSPAQTEVLALADRIANEDGVALTMDFRVGDAQFINNHAVLHARDAFVNGETSDEQRHLLRLWLTLPEGRALAPGYAVGIARQHHLPA